MSNDPEEMEESLPAPTVEEKAEAPTEEEVPETEEERKAREAEYTRNLKKYRLEELVRQEAACVGLKALTAELKALGVVSAEAEYDGSGDSGDIASVGFYAADSKDVAVSDELERRFSDAAMDLVCHRHGGWEINEGSFGKVTLHVDAGKVNIDHNERHEECTSEESEVDINEEEQGDSGEESGKTEPAKPPEMTEEEISGLLYDNNRGLLSLSAARVAKLKSDFLKLTGRRYEG